MSTFVEMFMISRNAHQPILVRMIGRTTFDCIKDFTDMFIHTG